MAKFNFDGANQKNVFSGEDGILFVHEKENGERCIEINSENFLYCIKTHLSPIISDFNIAKLWIRFITPHGKIIINLNDYAFITAKLAIPFFNMEEKKRFNNLMEELYDQIISIEKGDYMWKVLEARCNEDIWDGLTGDKEGNTTEEKFGKYMLKRIEDRKNDDHMKALQEIYSEILPETTKEIMALIESGQFMEVFKPIINILTLGLVHELITNTNILKKVSDFLTGKNDLISSFRKIFSLREDTYSDIPEEPKNTNPASIAKRYGAFNGGVYSTPFNMIMTPETNKELAEAITEAMKKEEKESHETKTNIDFDYIKNKFVGEIDSLLNMASNMDKEEFIIKLHKYKENFSNLFDLYKAKQDFDNEMKKLKDKYQ